MRTIGYRRLQAAVVAALAAAGTLYAQESCLLCHGSDDMKDVRLEFQDGSGRPLYISQQKLEDSVHGFLSCTDCHTAFSDEDHPSGSYADYSEYQAAAGEACSRCHTPGGMHERMAGLTSQLACSHCHLPHEMSRIDREQDSCLGCHSQPLVRRLADGDTLSLQVVADHLETSVHRDLRCVDCHFGFSAREHVRRDFEDRRHVTLLFSESCRRCHFDKYTRTLESVHYQLLEAGLTEAPVCVDCHGSHGVQSGYADKLTAARRCRNCHEEIYGLYASSVHGQALVDGSSDDVPICSSCHTAHQITDPTAAAFRNNVPQLCGDCHENGEVMERYGLSTNVVDSYLDDFHGVTLSFYKKEDASDRRIAVCTDCHGIHDIESLRVGDTGTVKLTLLQRCSQCHEGAGTNFPDTWISHYEPSLARAPLVYLIELFYAFFIPFVVIGLGLQIVLHIWRYAFRR